MAGFIIGDIHLRDIDEEVDWQYNYTGLNKFIQSLSLKPDDVFIQVGDFFDKPKHRGLTNFIAIKNVQELSKCKEVYLLQGNHDCTKYSGSNLDFLKISENIKVVKEIEVFNIHKMGKCLFLPYIEGLTVGGRYEDKVNEYMKDKGDINYIFGHHFFKELSIFDTPYLNLDLFNFSYKSVIQGHVHNYSKLGNNYCIGSVSQWNKGEIDQKKNYMIIDNDEIKIKPIGDSFFSMFVKTTWGSTTEIPDKDFIIVECKCKKEEKSLLEQDIRNTYTKNLYTIDWTFEDEIKDESIDIKSEEDLVNKFFEENKVTKKVKDLFYSYL